MIRKDNLGCMNFEGFVSRKEIDINKFKMAHIGGGQTGGKICSEFIRTGYYANLYNTCDQDLQDTEKLLDKMINVEAGKDYTTIRLDGFDGASKDRDIGLRAIMENKELLTKKLIMDKRIVDADFVWIDGALGGGTYNGSIKTVVQIVSGVMRKNKRFKVKVENGQVKDIGKATVGLICAIPEGFSKHKIKLNAAQALQEIKELHKKKLLGAVLLVDNQKLIDDFMKKENTDNHDWTTYGNTTVAQLITEIGVMCCIPGREAFDKSEIMDIISTPGFLTIGKKHLKYGWKKEKTDAEAITELIKDSFENQNIFADGYDYSKAIHGGLAVLAPMGNNILSVKDTILLKQELNNYLDSPEVEVTHFGVFENDIFGTYTEPMVSKLEAIVYTLAVTKELPKRILDMTKEAIAQEEKKQEQINDKDSELDDMLGGLLNTNDQAAASLDIDLADIWGDTEKKDENTDPFADIF
jgi:hypothetical protein